MPRVSPPISNFTAGEWSRLMDGQVALEQRQNACRTLENFVIMIQGGVTKRPGTRFIAEIKDSSAAARIIPFQYSSTQAYIIELGANYMRFFKDKGAVMSGSVPYEIGAAYPQSNIAKVRFCQAKDLMYLFHRSFPIQKLIRIADDNWTIDNAPIDNGPYLKANTVDEIGTNLAPNGDFETDTDCTSVGTPQLQKRQDSRVYEGSYARAFTADTANEGFALAIGETTTSKTYLVRFRVFTKATSLILKVKQGHVSGTYNVNEAITEIPEETWTEYERYFTELNGGADGHIEFLCADGESLGDELVSNGDFTLESGWYKVGTDEDYYSDYAYGYYYMSSDGTATHMGVRSSPFITETGKVYKVTFSINTPNGSAMMLWQHGDASSIVYTPISVAPGTPVTKTVYVEETAGGSSAYFGITTDYSADRTYIDDVTIKEVESHYNIDKVEVYEVDTITMTPSAKTGYGINLTASQSYFEDGHIGAFFQLTHNDENGYCIVRSVVSPTLAIVDVLSDFDDTASTAEWREGAWSRKNGYPSEGCFFEQRLMCANSQEDPDGIWGSKSTEYEDFEPGSLATDALSYKLQADIIHWLAGMNKLVAGTVNMEYIGNSGSDDALSSSNINLRSRSREGSADLEPIALGNSIIFAKRNGVATNDGKKLIELIYDYEMDGYKGIDLTLFASHVTGSGIKRIVYQSSPIPIIWACTDDGDLISLTYKRDQNVMGWSRHDVDGIVEDICVIAGDNQDELYLLVQRTINGATKRYIEVMEDFDFGDDQEDAFFVDCGLTYDSTATTTITGLDHLEGEEVAILADGAVQDNKTVASGQITLDTAASKVQVGLPYTATLQPLDLQGGSVEGTSAGKNKRIHGATVYFHKTAEGVYIGQDANNLEEIVFREPSDDVGEPVPLFTGSKDNFNFMGDWLTEATLMIKHSQPSPCTVLAIMPRFRTEDR